MGFATAAASRRARPNNTSGTVRAVASKQPSEQPEQPTISDGVVILRPFRPDDAPAVFEACQDPEIARWVPIPWPYTRADADAYIGLTADEWREGRGASFAVVEAASGRLVGSMDRHGPRRHRATFGYWLAPEARGRGYATRALRLIVDWTMRSTDVVRFDLYTFAGNDASGRVAERAGFTREGVLRAWEVHRGVPQDCVFYSLIRPG